jgi:hypothetical protein
VTLWWRRDVLLPPRWPASRESQHFDEANRGQRGGRAVGQPVGRRRHGRERDCLGELLPRRGLPGPLGEMLRPGRASPAPTGYRRGASPGPGARGAVQSRSRDAGKTFTPRTAASAPEHVSEALRRVQVWGRPPRRVPSRRSTCRSLAGTLRPAALKLVGGCRVRRAWKGGAQDAPALALPTDVVPAVASPQGARCARAEPLCRPERRVPIPSSALGDSCVAAAACERGSRPMQPGGGRPRATLMTSRTAVRTPAGIPWALGARRRPLLDVAKPRSRPTSRRPMGRAAAACRERVGSGRARVRRGGAATRPPS